MSRLLFVATFAFLAMALAGCDRGPVRHKVSGVVDLDGQPVVEGTLTFRPTDPNLPPEGAPIANGKYNVAIVAGTFKVEVFIQKKVPLGPGESSPYGDNKKIINGVPDHYNDNPPIADVKGSGEINFNLKSKKG